MKILVMLLFMYVTMLALLLLMENHIIFIPSRDLWTTPERAGVPFEDVFLTTADGVKIHGWWLPAAGAHESVLFLHGNAGNIADRLENAIRLTRLGLSVLLVDYRGYGRSEGSPNEEGIYKDAEAAYAHLLERTGQRPESIVLFGRSLGSGPAVDLATRRPCKALIIESAFCSTRAMARSILLYRPFAPFIPDRFQSLAKIRNVRCPVMVVHGSRDEMIPLSHGQALFEAAPGPKRFYTLEGATHNDWYQRDPAGYFAAWAEFLGLPQAGARAAAVRP